MRHPLTVKILFLCCLLLCLFPFMDAAYALLAGIILSMALGNPWPQQAATASKKLLQLSVVGLGFGLSLGEVWTTGRASIIYTFFGICFTLLLGTALGRLFKVEKRTASLVAFGTAICGGSAIAAMAPVLKAEDDEIAVSLATVFTLNAVALLLFPVIGHQLHLSQTIFGTWAGMAIHDTSSVVGAASVYGAKALAVGDHSQTVAGAVDHPLCAVRFLAQPGHGQERRAAVYHRLYPGRGHPHRASAICSGMALAGADRQATTGGDAVSDWCRPEPRIVAQSRGTPAAAGSGAVVGGRESHLDLPGTVWRRLSDIVF